MEATNAGSTTARAGQEASRPLWRRALSAARAQGERALHASRRRRAWERIQALAGARSVLFVCHGNIYRSPFAAARFVAAVDELGLANLRVGSAGFVGPDRPSPADARQLARNFGVDLSAHRSQLLNGAMVAEWDVIVVMAAQQAHLLVEHFGVAPHRLLVLGDCDPETIERREIADPWSDPQQILEGSYARVDRCVRALADRAASCWASTAMASELGSPPLKS